MPPLKSLLTKIIVLLMLAGIFGAVVFLAVLAFFNLRIVGLFTLFVSPFVLLVVLLDKFTSLKGPIRYVARRMFLAVYNTSVYRRKFIWEQLYDILCWAIPSTEWKHMNWGYATLASPNGAFITNLAPEDETERYSIQLYHHMATAMATWTDLTDKTLVEVSSGRGGGLDYISRYLNPKKCIGVDLSAVQTDYCRKIYANNQKLMFVEGQAEKLSKVKELESEQVNIVINVESGHCYANFSKFVQEVGKVLQPGGVFAYSDFRPTHEWDHIEKELESHNLKIIKKENISENVMKSLKLDEERKWELIKSRLGPVLRFFFKQIGGVKGSHIYEGLSSGNMRSAAYVLKKF